MTHRAVRLALLVYLLGAQALAAYWLIRVDAQAAAVRAGGRLFDRKIERLLDAIAECRGAQQGYVATGQDHRYWRERASTALRTIYEALAHLRAGASAGATAALDEASVAVREFTRLDARAREYLEKGERLVASDLIFTETAAAVSTAATRIADARDREQQAREALLAAHRRSIAYILAAVAGIPTLALLVLILRQPPQFQPMARRVAAEDTPADAAYIPEFDPQPAPAVASEAPERSPAGDRLPDLAAAGRLCTDFGRVFDVRDLVGWLERAAELIDASGIIVWVGDRSGTYLSPGVAYGYSAEVLERLGAVPRDADNAAAAAYRAEQVRVVDGGGSSNGAVVAPLITPHGCVGVLTAEVRHGAEHNEAVRALTTIIAAQVASLVSAAPAQEGTQASAGA